VNAYDKVDNNQPMSNHTACK